MRPVVIPLEPCIQFKGTLDGEEVVILKDGGCNTNMVSQRIVNKVRHNWATKLKKTNYQIVHSKNNTSELSVECLEAGKLEIGDHKYSSNWAVGDARYDVILGMPWHAECEKSVDYTRRTVKINDDSELQAIPNNSHEHSTRVSSISIKEFRKKLRKNKIVELYYVTIQNF